MKTLDALVGFEATSSWPTLLHSGVILMQENLAAALFGCAVLRALSRRTVDIEESGKMLKNASELESVAVALLQQYASTNPRLTETILIRAVPVIGNRTLLHMARFAGALRTRRRRAYSYESTDRGTHSRNVMLGSFLARSRSRSRSRSLVPFAIGLLAH